MNDNNKIAFYRCIVSKTKKRDLLFNKQLQSFLNQNQNPLIFVISETKHIGNSIKNRPMKIVEQLLKYNYDVMYAYRRSNEEILDVKRFDNNHLFQAPLNLFQQHLDIIASINRKQKIILFECPLKSFVDYIKTFKENNWLVCYDIRDDWQAMKEENLCHWYDKENENKLIDQSDIIYAVSDKLLQNVRNKNRKYLIPNGIGECFLNAPKVKKIKNKIGYFGHLNDAWFDFSLLEYIAKKNPDKQFEIIGPYNNNNNNNNMCFLENIWFMGEKSTEEIINIASQWAYGIIPFKKNNITYHCDPIKVYEYLALKLPVISTNIDVIKNYPFVFIANTEEEFSNLLCTKKMVNENVVDAFVNQSTMKRRVEEMIRLWRGFFDRED